MELVYEIFSLYAERAGWFAELLGSHIKLALTAIAMAGAIGLALGVWVAEHPKAAPFVIGVCNVFYTIPAISLLGILIPFTGIGNKTAVIALTIYGVMPMVRNTHAGLTSIDPDVLEAARGMGSTRWQILARVKLPLAAGDDPGRGAQHGGDDRVGGGDRLVCGRGGPGGGHLPGHHHL